MNNTLRLSAVSILLTALLGCSNLLDKDRGFTEPVTGAVMIARDIIVNDKKQGGCDSKPKSKRAACKKEVEALAKSFERQKDRK